MTLSDFRAGHHPIEDVEGATFTTPGSPAMTQFTFPTCRAQYPGGSNRCLSMSSLSVLPSPVIGRVGIHDELSRPAQASLTLRPVRLLARPKADVCPEAPTQPVTRPSRSVATMLINNYMGGSSPHWRTAPLRRTDNLRAVSGPSAGRGTARRSAHGLDAIDHHDVVESMLAPAPQPAYAPIAKPGTQRD